MPGDVTETPVTEANGEALPVAGSTILSPREHAIALGHIKRARSVIFGEQGGDTTELRTPEYRAAEALHGWAAHVYQTAEPMRITREAYELAIAAAKEPDEKGNYTPCSEALAPHLTKGAK